MWNQVLTNTVKFTRRRREFSMNERKIKGKNWYDGKGGLKSFF